MSKYFKKINLDLSDLDLFNLNSNIELHRPNNLNFVYKKIIDQYVYREIKNRIPNEYQIFLLDIFYCVVESPFFVFPHVDKRSATVINYYHQPGNSITKFYEPIVSNPRKYSIKNNLIENSFDLEDIRIVDSFSANEHDCYILNVSKIHSVDLTGEIDRHFINISFSEKL